MPESVLGEYFDRLVDDLVKKGRFASRDEVIRAGLRLLEDHEKKRAVIHEEIIRMLREGEDSGPGIPMDEVFERLLQRGQKVAEGAAG